MICRFPFAHPATAGFPFDEKFTAVISVSLTVHMPKSSTFWAVTTPSWNPYATRFSKILYSVNLATLTLTPENLPWI